MLIDVAPGVDWTAMWAVVLAIQQVGFRGLKLGLRVGQIWGLGARVHILGAGSEMSIDVAPGVDWTAMVAVVLAIQQVGARGFRLLGFRVGQTAMVAVQVLAKSRGLRPSRTSVISRQAGSCIARSDMRGCWLVHAELGPFYSNLDIQNMPCQDWRLGGCAPLHPPSNVGLYLLCQGWRLGGCAPLHPPSITLACTCCARAGG